MVPMRIASPSSQCRTWIIRKSKCQCHYSLDWWRCK